LKQVGSCRPRAGESSLIVNERKGGVEMSVKKSVLVVMAAVIVLGAGIAAAQTSTYEIKQGTVISVYGNHLVVKMASGETKDVEVPEGFMFTVDGRSVPLSALKPGTKLTSTVKTTTTPKTVQTTEVKNAEVVKVVGQTVILRGEDGKLKRYNKVPDNITLTRGGKEMNPRDLAPGMRLTATLVHESVVEITEKDVAVAGQAPAKPKPAPMPAAAPAPAPAPVLPKTASSLPLVGFGGIALLILAIGIGIYRRF